MTPAATHVHPAGVPDRASATVDKLPRCRFRNLSNSNQAAFQGEILVKSGHQNRSRSLCAPSARLFQQAAALPEAIHVAHQPHRRRRFAGCLSVALEHPASRRFLWHGNLERLYRPHHRCRARGWGHAGTGPPSAPGWSRPIGRPLTLRRMRCLRGDPPRMIRAYISWRPPCSNIAGDGVVP
jgi:hypothetical protein